MFRVPLAVHVPMFGFTVLAFLIVCAILAVATYLVFKSGEQGTTKLGGCAGCAVGFALLAIAGMAASMCAGVILLSTKAELVRHGPIRRLELDLDHDGDEDAAMVPGEQDETEQAPAEQAHDGADRDHPASDDDKALHPVAPTPSEVPGAAAKDASHAVHLRLTIRGKEYPAEIADWIREHTSGDVTVTVTHRADRTIVDLALPITRKDVQQFKHDMKDALPGMKLPKGIKVDIKEVDE